MMEKLFPSRHLTANLKIQEEVKSQQPVEEGVEVSTLVKGKEGMREEEEVMVVDIEKEEVVESICIAVDCLDLVIFVGRIQEDLSALAECSLHIRVFHF